jgi:hypothetical protein
MKLLVDEGVDQRLRLLFPGHDCQTAVSPIWLVWKPGNS